MIAPQELRLGNWININGSPFQVELPDLNLIANKNGKSTYETIELTEDWFKKFGSIPAEAHDFVLKNIFFINFGGFYYRAFLEGKTRIDVELKFVHQLQNLFFALTGEELKIKES